MPRYTGKKPSHATVAMRTFENDPDGIRCFALAGCGPAIAVLVHPVTGSVRDNRAPTPKEWLRHNRIEPGVDRLVAAWRRSTNGSRSCGGRTPT